MESATVLAQIQICFSISFCSALDSLSYLTVISKASQVGIPQSVEPAKWLLADHIKKLGGQIGCY